MSTFSWGWGINLTHPVNLVVYYYIFFLSEYNITFFMCCKIRWCQQLSRKFQNCSTYKKHMASKNYSRTQMFFKISVLKNFATVKHECLSLFQIKLKKRLQHRCFPVNIAEFLRTTFFIENLRWLLQYWATGAFSY